MMQGYRLAWSFGLALVLTAAAAVAQDSVKSCADCHGEAGTSDNEKMPVIGGMSSFYLEYALEAYQQDGRSCPETEYPDGDRPATSMCEVAKALDKAQIGKVAAHYAAHKFVAVNQDTDPALVKNGEKLHQRHCAKCHTHNGANAEDDAGILAGQWKAYLMFTMEDFRAGKRPTLKKMQEKLDALKPAEVEALAHFYAAQR